MNSQAVIGEVIRHRLHAINDESATVLQRVSGSPIAVESNDLNTVITARDGQVVACGHYVVAQVASMHLVIEHLLAEYHDNPGIGPGDQFITNDPYLGTLHQPDVVVVAPIFFQDELVAWCGSVVHQMDVGGPTPGGVSYEARSVFDEAPAMPPMRIVEAGRVRRDIEREYLSRSRTPEFNALDLAGQVAANQRATEQVIALCARYGAEVVTGVMDRLLDSSERLVRERLLSISDGRWRHVAYVEYRAAGVAGGEEEIYEVALTMTKVGDELVVDFSESSPQAPGAINAGFGALANYAIGSVMIHLCSGLPWVPGGISRAVKLISTPGTVVHAKWPAGVAMSTGSTVHAIRTCINLCLGRMLQTNPDLISQVMASCQCAGAGGPLSGRDRSGNSFASMTLDDVSGGGGARSDSDGLDSSGFTTSPGSACMNVEVNESYLPMLYRSRKELPDSGGPGLYRGGVGSLNVWEPYGSTSPIELLSFGQGLQHQGAAGLAGGQPGGQSIFAVRPEAEVEELTRAVGQTSSWDLEMPVAGMEVLHGDVNVTASQGGGGFGDPIERDPQRVLADVEGGLVTQEGARRDYAVVIDGTVGQWQLDEQATNLCRRERRCDRLGGTEPLPAVVVEATPFDHCFGLLGVGSEQKVVCRRCGTGLADQGEDVYQGLIVRERGITEGAPLGVRYPGSGRFVVRSLFCPGCARQVDCQVARAGSPIVRAAEPGWMSAESEQSLD